MLLRSSRRIVRRALAVGVVLVATHVPVVGQHARAQAAVAMEQPQLLRSVRSQTYAYKTVGDLQIKADVHRFDDEMVRPVVIWIHGGALINGNRGGLFGVAEMMLEAGQSVMMAEQFKQHGVAHELVTIPGGEHGLGGGDPQLIAKAYDDVVAWVNRYMR